MSHGNILKFQGLGVGDVGEYPRPGALLLLDLKQGEGRAFECREEHAGARNTAAGSQSASIS